MPQTQVALPPLASCWGARGVGDAGAYGCTDDTLDTSGTYSATEGAPSTDGTGGGISGGAHRDALGARCADNSSDTR